MHLKMWTNTLMLVFIFSKCLCLHVKPSQRNSDEFDKLGNIQKEYKRSRISLENVIHRQQSILNALNSLNSDTESEGKTDNNKSETDRGNLNDLSRASSDESDQSGIDEVNIHVEENYAESNESRIKDADDSTEKYNGSTENEINDMEDENTGEENYDWDQYPQIYHRDPAELDKDLLDPDSFATDLSERNTVYGKDGPHKATNIKPELKEVAKAFDKEFHKTLHGLKLIKEQDIGHTTKRNFHADSSWYWKGTSIPYVIAADTFGDQIMAATSLIEKAVSLIASSSCVSWKRRTTEEHYIVFVGNSGSCSSFVGYIQRANQTLSLDTQGCLFLVTALHEMMHAMGAQHEQSRTDRYDDITINWDNVVDGRAFNFEQERTKDNFPYDYGSVMHYRVTDFAKNGGTSLSLPDADLMYLITNQKHDLSYYDKAEINKAYKCGDSCNIQCMYNGIPSRIDSECRCVCPSGLQGQDCSVLETTPGCGGKISLSYGEKYDIILQDYKQNQHCTWLVQGELSSRIRAKILSMDLPYNDKMNCFHWIEIRDYLIGSPGKQICGNNTTVFTKKLVGNPSLMMVRFNSITYDKVPPGLGFSIQVEAYRSGCVNFPCQYGSTCRDTDNGQFFTCDCTEGFTGDICNNVEAKSSLVCDMEHQLDDCVFEQDRENSDFDWSIITQRSRAFNGTLVKAKSGFQFAYMENYRLVFYYLWKSQLVTKAHFEAAHRCLRFSYVLSGNGLDEKPPLRTQLNIYIEGSNKPRQTITINTHTNSQWADVKHNLYKTENLKIIFEGVFGRQRLGLDDIIITPDLCVCEADSCSGHGVCTERDSVIQCECSEGYSGKYCSVDACYPDPCNGNGVCKRINNGYSCQCRSGFSGTRCQIDMCGWLQCSEHGTCERTDHGYVCNCTQGYSGKHCEIDMCGSLQCGEHGICKRTEDAYVCECDPGFSGNHCQNDVCDPNPCENQGICKRASLGFTCQCKDGYSGEKCEKDECLPDPCNGHGVCYRKPVGVGCHCHDGFTGQFCETDKCQPHPCNGHGVCVRNALGVRCQCHDGHRGQFCETDGCQPDPCHGHGVCRRDQSGVRCQCFYGYTGQFCEQERCEKSCGKGGFCIVSETGPSCQLYAGCQNKDCTIEVVRPFIPIMTTGYTVSTNIDFGLMAGVTGQQGMLTPPWHLIPPLASSGVRDCPFIPASFSPHRLRVCLHIDQTLACDFESDDDTCFLTEDITGMDDFDWTRISWRNTRKIRTLPKKAEHGVYYKYIDAGMHKRYSKAILISSKIFANMVYCFEFYYHISGFGKVKNFGSLTIKTKRHNSKEKVIWKTNKRERGEWIYRKLNLKLDPLTKIIIEGFVGKGRRGDIAIDNILLSVGPCY